MIPYNEEAKRVALRRTLFFMPHCSFSLYWFAFDDEFRYNGLMWANWGEHMKNVVVVGNSFSQFVKNMDERMNRSETNAITPLLPYVSETPLEIDTNYDGHPLSGVYDAFHDLSVHVISDSDYEAANKAGLWLKRPKEVILGQIRDSGKNEAVDAYEDELEDNEDHEEEVKRRHEALIREEENRYEQMHKGESEDHETGPNGKEVAGQFKKEEEGEEESDDSDSDSDDDDDDDDDMFERMYTGWGTQVGSLLKPDRFTPEWSVDSSTINAYALGEKDPRQRIFVYNDEGVSPASKQMCVHTLRSFSNPARYIVDTIDADELKEKDWEETAAMLVFPGGADKLYRVVAAEVSNL